MIQVINRRVRGIRTSCLPVRNHPGSPSDGRAVLLALATYGKRVPESLERLRDEFAQCHYRETIALAHRVRHPVCSGFVNETCQQTCARCRLSGKHSAIGHPHRCFWENTQEPWILQVLRLLFEFNIIC